jgi:hypothetical protein
VVEERRKVRIDHVRGRVDRFGGVRENVRERDFTGARSGWRRRDRKISAALEDCAANAADLVERSGVPREARASPNP